MSYLWSIVLWLVNTLSLKVELSFFKMNFIKSEQNFKMPQGKVKLEAT